MASGSNWLREREHSDSRPTGRARNGNGVPGGQRSGVKAGQGGGKREGGVLTTLFDLRLGDLGGVRTTFGLEEDAERQAEDEEGREDGGLRFLVEFLLDTLEEVLEEVEETTIDRFGDSLGGRGGMREQQCNLLVEPFCL